MSQRQLCIDPMLKKDESKSRELLRPHEDCTCPLFNLHPDPQTLP